MKEVLVAAIGGIGLPEALPCLEMLIKTITGESSKNKQCDPQVKCMAVWALGRLACLHTISHSQRIIKQVLSD